MRTGREIKVKLLMLRHGATASNEAARYLGRTDEGLSEGGRRDLRNRKDRIIAGFETPDMVYISPMLRGRESAEILFPSIRPSVIEAWKEMDFGIFEGKNYRELSGNPVYQKWVDSYARLPIPEGESRGEFTKRCMAGLAECLEQVCAYSKHTGKNTCFAAAVVHGGTIMDLLSSLAGGDYFSYHVGNGCGRKLEFSCYNGEYILTGQEIAEDEK